MNKLSLTALLALSLGADARADDLFEARLVKDINSAPAPVASEPGDFHVLNGKIYFTANQRDVGRQLFESDGISSHARAVGRSTPELPFYAAALLGSVNARLIVFSRDETALTLWSVDPLDGQRTALTSFSFQPPQPIFEPMANLPGRVVFRDTNRDTIWTSDGTPEGTLPIFTGAGPYDSQFRRRVCRLPEQILFTRTTEGDTQLWRSDGTPEGTANFAALVDAWGPIATASTSDTCYFAHAHQSGLQLWRSDGSAAGTVRLPVTGSGFDVGLQTTAEAAYALTPAQLWRLDQTQPLVSGLSDARDLASTGTAVAYTVLAGANRHVFVHHAGTSTPRTVLLGNLPLQLPNAPGSRLVAIGDLLFARGDRQLYAIDTASATATQVAGSADVFPEATDRIFSGGVAYGVGDDGETGREVWRSDGTSIGTRLLHDIAQATADALSFDSRFAVHNNTVYFNAIGRGDDGVNRKGLVRSDGTESGTQWLPRALYDDSDVERVEAFDDGVLFLSAATASASTVWHTDATFAQTRRLDGPIAGLPEFHGDASLRTYACFNGDDAVCALRAGIGPPAVIATAGGESTYVPVGMIGSTMLYFHRDVLWRSDGTAPGTYALGNLRSWRYWPDLSTSTWPVKAIQHAGRLIFQACTAPDVESCGLYASDGTTAPQTLAAVSAYVRVSSTYGDSIAFVAGNQLWTSDGTPEKTEPRTEVPFVTSMFESGGLLHMIGWTFTIGINYGYYVSNATSAGTRLLPAVSGSWLMGASFMAYDDHVLLSCPVGSFGSEVCVLDGATGDIRQIIDIRPGALAANPRFVARTADAVYLSAHDGAHGYELWRVTPRTDALFADGFE